MFIKKGKVNFNEYEMECLRSALSDHIALIEKELKYNKKWEFEGDSYKELKRELKLSKKLEKKLLK